MQTKHGKLNCTTRVTNYMHWLETENDIGELESGLQDIIQKEYNVTLTLEGGQDVYAAYIEGNEESSSVHKSMIKMLLRQPYITYSNQVELILKDLFLKGILLPGNYIVRV